MSAITFLAATARDRAGAPVTVRLAGGGSHSPYLLAGEHFLAGLFDRPRFRAELGFGEDGWTGGTVPTTGEVAWMPADPARLRELAGLYWPDAAIAVEGGPEGGPIGRLLTGTVANAAVADGILKLTIADLSASIDKPLLGANFTGTGGFEGPTEAAGRAKRRSWGLVWNVEARPLAPAYEIHEVGDPGRPLQAITAVRDKGREGPLEQLAWAGSADATLTALKGRVPPRGGAVVAPSIACVRWWTTPTGPLTCDLVGEVGTAARVLPIASALLAAAAGPAIVDLAAADALRPAPAGLHVARIEETAAQALDRLLLGVSLLWVLDPAGRVRVREWTWTPVAEEPLQARFIARERTLPPMAKRRVGYRANNRVHSAAEISAAILMDDIADTANYQRPTPGQLEKLGTIAEGATNTRTYEGPAPANPRDGDTWVANLGTPVLTYERVGGQWVLGATVGATAVEAGKLGTIAEGATNDQGADTRSVDYDPAHYRTNWLRRIRNEFKARAVVGAPGAGVYGTLVTVTTWPDYSGDAVSQVFTDTNGAQFIRKSNKLNPEGWSAWVASYSGYKKPAFNGDLLRGDGQLATETDFRTSLGEAANTAKVGTLPVLTAQQGSARAFGAFDPNGILNGGIQSLLLLKDRSLANVDAGANTKLGGVQQNATAGSIIGLDLRLADFSLATEDLLVTSRGTAYDVTRVSGRLAAQLLVDLDGNTQAVARLADDNLLSALEKPELMTRRRELDERYNASSTASLGFDIPGVADPTQPQRFAADDAVAAVRGYLDGLVPGYADLSVDTPIDGVLFRSKLGTAYEKVSALERANLEEAARRGQWPQIKGPGRPQDNATVGGLIGTNIRLADFSLATEDLLVTSRGTAYDTQRIDGLAAATARQGSARGFAALDEFGFLKAGVHSLTRLIDLSLGNVDAGAAAKLGGVAANAGAVLDTRAADSPPSFYYALQVQGVGERQEFKSGNFAASGSSGFGTLITTSQWTDPSGGPVKQVLTDSGGKTVERISLSTTAWGPWVKNYTGFQKPNLDTDTIGTLPVGKAPAEVLNSRIVVDGNGFLKNPDAIGGAASWRVANDKITETDAFASNLIRRPNGGGTYTGHLAADRAAGAGLSFVDGTAAARLVGMADNADVTIRQPVVSRLDPVTGRPADPRFGTASQLIGLPSATTLVPTYSDNTGGSVQVNIPAHTRKFPGVSAPILLSYGAGSGRVPNGVQWWCYVSDPDLAGVSAPAYLFTTDPSSALFAAAVLITSGLSPIAPGAPPPPPPPPPGDGALYPSGGNIP